MSLTNLLPDDINLFLCDYHDGDLIALDRKKAVNKLIAKNGGPLGVQFFEEIEIGTEDPVEFENKLAKTLGVLRKGHELRFPEGPNLRFTKSNIPFLVLIVKVKSINKAKLELDALGFKVSISEQGVQLTDDIFSTRITLIE